MSLYDRLGFNFDTTKFNGDDSLSANVLNFLGNTSINLSTWQQQDLANAQVGGYFQNPHNDVIGVISVYVTGMAVYANTINFDYGANTDIANTMANVVSNTQTSLENFATHTNNLSGVTYSFDTSLYPDLNSALAVGRQMLSLTNKIDGVQNNTPVLGNFTSLYINPDLITQSNVLKNDYITIVSSIGGANGNTSNISTDAMNTIISNVQTFQTLIDGRRTADITFYINSNQILKEYFTVSQFSSLGATQNSLIKMIGTDKLKADLT